MSAVDEPRVIGPKILTPSDVICDLFAYAQLPTIPTGFCDINGILNGGMRPTQPVILNAATGSGKTSFGCQVAAHNAVEGCSLIWSTEMHPTQLVARILAQRTGHNSLDLMRTSVASMGPKAMLEHCPAGLRFYSGASLEGLEVAVKQLSDETGVTPLVVVDYLQKAARYVGIADDSRMSVEECSEQLRAISMRQTCAMLTISAVSRMGATRTRSSREHDAEDLIDTGRESSAIEYDAAVVLVLGLEKGKDTAIVSVAKNRDGRTGQVEFEFDGPTGKFTELGAIDPDAAVRGMVERVLTAWSDDRSEWLSKTEIVRRVGGRRTDMMRAVSAMVGAKTLASDDRPSPKYRPIS